MSKSAWLHIEPVPRSNFEYQDWISFVATQTPPAAEEAQWLPAFSFLRDSYRVNKVIGRPRGEHFTVHDFANFPLDPTLWSSIDAFTKSFRMSPRIQLPFRGEHSVVHDSANFPLDASLWPAIASLPASFKALPRIQLPFRGEPYYIDLAPLALYESQLWPAISFLGDSFRLATRLQIPPRGQHFVALDIAFDATLLVGPWQLLSSFRLPVRQQLPLRGDHFFAGDVFIGSTGIFWSGVEAFLHSFRTGARPSDWKRVSDNINVDWINGFIMVGIDVCIVLVDIALTPQLQLVAMKGDELIDVKIVDDIKFVKGKC